MKFLAKVWRLLRQPRSLRRQYTFAKDYLIFRLKYGYLKIPSPPPTKDIVLIVNFSETPHRATTEGLLAKAFEREGTTPIVATTRNSKWEERYFRAVGIERFVYLEDYVDPSIVPAMKKEVREFLNKKPSHNDLLNFTYRGINVGVNTLSTVLKRYRRGNVNIQEPEVDELVEKTLLHSFTSVHAAEKMIDELQPKALVFNETGYSPYGEIFGYALKKHLNCPQYVHSQQLDSLVPKRYSRVDDMVDPVSLARSSWEKVKAMPWSKEEEEAFMEELTRRYQDRTWFNLTLSKKKKDKSPQEVRAQLHLDPAKKTAVVFNHVVWDASFFYGKNLFHDYEDWLVETVKVACENPHVNWVIKLHPDYVWHTKDMEKDSDIRDMIMLLANVPELPQHVQIVRPDTDLSTFSFFAITDYCITVRGTIGIECPCFGIPVFTAGTGRYWNMGFTEDSATVEEYKDKLRRIHQFPALTPERRTLARKHAWALFKRRPVHCTSIEMVPLYRNGEVYDHRTKIHAKNRQEAVNDPGLKTVAQWMLNSRDEDYLG